MNEIKALLVIAFIIAALEIAAMIHGINGKAFASAIGAIGLIVGYIGKHALIEHQKKSFMKKLMLQHEKLKLQNKRR